MGVPAKTSRQALLERGWYVVTDVQLAFLGLSGKAHDLLIIIKHFQGDKDSAAPDQQRLATAMGWSVRTVSRVLAELAGKGALTTRRTGRSNRYAVMHILGTPDEIRVLLGAELEIPSELVRSDQTTVGRSDTPDPGGSPSYKEPLQNQEQDLLPSGGGDACAPHAETGLEDGMGIRGVQPNAALEDEFDPATSLGLWESQETPENAADDLDGLFPEEEVSSPAAGPQRPPRSRAQADSVGSLAFEFEQLVRQQPWGGPSPVNKAALARNLSQWKRDGLTPDQIRAMMQRYAAPDFARKPGKAPWIDFLGQRHKLLAVGERHEQARAMEEHRHDTDESYWLGTMAGSQ